MEAHVAVRPWWRGWFSMWLSWHTHFRRMASFFLSITPILVVHEGGHNLFGWFGPTLGLWGGTLLQWLVPLLLAAYFFSQRQTAGFVFCLFFFFENWLYTATYMADARAQDSHWSRPAIRISWSTISTQYSPAWAYLVWIPKSRWSFAG